MPQTNPPRCLIILAGGQSRRMGHPKATLALGGQRLIDRAISRHNPGVEHLLLSASSDLDTGLEFVPDDPEAPDGPVGAIFTLATKLAASIPGLSGFATIPVDAPFVPDQLVAKLLESDECMIAEGTQRMHPTFAYWQCDVVNAIAEAHEPGVKAPSLHWLARRCGGRKISWPDERAFLNINTPDDLREAEESLAK